MKPQLLRTFLLFTFCISFAQNGTPDSNFGISGTLSIDFPLTNTDSVSAIQILPDGGYLISGTTGGTNLSAAFLMSLNSDGIGNTNFGNLNPKTGVYKAQYSPTTTNSITEFVLDASGNIFAVTKEGSNYRIRKILADGSGEDANFTTINLVLNAAVKIKKLIYYQADASLFLLTSGGSYGFELYKFSDSGDPITSFGTNGVVSYTSSFTGNTMLITPENTILVAGSSNIGNYPITGFVQLNMQGNANSYVPNFSYTFTSSANAATSATLDNNGYVLLGAYSTDLSGAKQASLLHVNYRTGAVDGLEDNTGGVILDSDFNSYSENIKGLFYGQEGNIIAYGQTINGNPLVLSIKPDGTMDSSFAVNGTYLSSITATIQCGGFAYNESRLLFGINNKISQPYILLTKLVINQQALKFNIIGKEIVSLQSQEEFEINPVLPGYLYEWSNNSDSVYVFGKNYKSTYTLFIPKGAADTYITVTCIIKDGSGNIVDRVPFTFYVSKEPTLADQLTEMQCPFAQTNANLSFINAVWMGDGMQLSDTSGISRSGYSDYTASKYDSIQIGNRISIKLSCPSPNPQFVGAWVDLNNDGLINESYEFMGAGYVNGKDSIVYIYNGLIHPQATAGPARLRLRSRSTKAFDASEYCSEYTDDGETEDYLLLLYEGDNTIAPNFITPNNDGKNDYFVIKGIDQKSTGNKLKIFDRTGNLIFEMKNYDNSWSGTSSSGEVKAGTYYFVFTQFYDDANRKFEDVNRGFLEIRY